MTNHYCTCSGLGRAPVRGLIGKFGAIKVSVLIMSVGVLAIPHASASDCPETGWLDGFGQAGLGGAGLVIIHRPAADPQLEGELIVGGSFGAAGGLPTGNIAILDLDTNQWSSFGSLIGGSNNSVTAIAELPDGSVIAGGLFVEADGQPASNLAIHDGLSWQSFEGGTNGRVWAIAVLQNGDIVIAGEFSMAGDTLVNNIALWNGSSWSSMGDGLDDRVNALVVLPNGDLVAGGRFSQTRSQSVSLISRWDGSSWSTIGNGIVDSVVNPPDVHPQVYALAVGDDGTLYAGGVFVQSDWPNVNGTPSGNVTKWTGTDWERVGSGFFRSVYGLRASQGQLIASGDLTTSETPVAVFDENLGDWVILPSAPASIAQGRDLFVTNDGDILVAVSSSAQGFLRWDGSQWRSVGAGIDGGIASMTAVPGEQLVVGGSFQQIGIDNVQADYLVIGDGVNWTEFAPGLDSDVRHVARLSNGDYIVSGRFLNAGDVPVNRIARWDGAEWFPMGSGFPQSSNTVNALVEMPSGDIVIGGSFASVGGVTVNNVARWDGSAWHDMALGLNNTVRDLVLLPSGDLVAVGTFTSSNDPSLTVPQRGLRRIAVWNGSGWARLTPVLAESGPPSGSILSAMLHSSGELVIAGTFQDANWNTPALNIARWTGSAWSAIGDGLGVGAVGEAVYDLVERQDGEIIAVGNVYMSGSTPLNRLARWNGTEWLAINPGPNGQATKLALRTPTELAIAGAFANIEGVLSSRFARYSFEPDCPCPCDIDGDGSQTISDYFSYLTNFFAQLGGPGSADFDGDGEVTVSDYFAFLGCLPAIAASQSCP